MKRVNVTPYLACALYEALRYSKMEHDMLTEALCKDILQEEYSCNLTSSELDKVLSFLAGLKVFRIHEDPLTQKYIEYLSNGADLKLKVFSVRQDTTGQAGTKALADFLLGDKDNSEPASSEYLSKNNALDVVDRYIDLGPDWLNEAIDKIVNYRTAENEDSLTESVPASDRIVSRSDNQPAFDEVIEHLEKITQDVGGNNEFASSEPDIRSAVIADLNAGQELLRSDSFWLKSIWETVIKALRYLRNKFGEAAIGIAASELLQLLLPLLGLG